MPGLAACTASQCSAIANRRRADHAADSAYTVKPPSRSTICVTLNREEEIRPEHVHARFEYDHPVFDNGALAAQRRWSEINGVRNTWYCGAWWGYGFHEDGAASGKRVADALTPQHLRLVTR